MAETSTPLMKGKNKKTHTGKPTAQRQKTILFILTKGPFQAAIRELKRITPINRPNLPKGKLVYVSKATSIGAKDSFQQAFITARITILESGQDAF
jgi:hypothetical protein